MKRRDTNNRIKWLHLRLTVQEYKLVERRFKKTTCRKLSEYIRAVIFDKPVIATYRNASLDDFMKEMIALNRELNAIGNNLNQSVKKLHTIQPIEFSSWQISYEVQSREIERKSSEIKLLLQKLTELWLR